MFLHVLAIYGAWQSLSALGILQDSKTSGFYFIFHLNYRRTRWRIIASPHDATIQEPIWCLATTMTLTCPFCPFHVGFEKMCSVSCCFNCLLKFVCCFCTLHHCSFQTKDQIMHGMARWAVSCVTSKRFFASGRQWQSVSLWSSGGYGTTPAQHLCLPMLKVTCYKVLEDMKHYEVLLLGMQLAQSVNGDVCSLEKILSKMSSSAHARHSLHGSDPGGWPVWDWCLRRANSVRYWELCAFCDSQLSCCADPLNAFLECLSQVRWVHQSRAVWILVCCVLDPWDTEVLETKSLWCLLSDTRAGSSIKQNQTEVYWMIWTKELCD